MNPGEEIRKLRLERWNLQDSQTGKRIKVDGERASKENIALNAGITSRTLTDIEDNITQQPAQRIIEAIFQILDRYKTINWYTKRDILGAYGYRLAIIPPSEEEGKRACESWERASSEYWFPSYLVDITHRIWAWNRFAPRLLGIRSQNDPRINEFRGINLLDLNFDLVPRYVRIINRDECLSSFVDTLKALFQPYHGEEWCHQWLNNARARYPEFALLYDRSPNRHLSSPEAANQIPIILATSDDRQLKFLVNSGQYANDPRFAIAQWMPLDDFTTSTCQQWKAESTDL